MDNKTFAAAMRQDAERFEDIVLVTKEQFLRIADRIEAAPGPAVRVIMRSSTMGEREKTMHKDLTLMETATMMGSSDYKERFKAEYYQLKIRYKKLKVMCAKYEDGTLEFEPTCSLELLLRQLAAMHRYLKCLEKRAEVEGIEL